MKKNDLILIGILLLISTVFFLYNGFGMEKGSQIVITVNDEIFGSYSLNEEQTIPIDEHNTLKISNGQADMIWADCPDELCIKQKPISKSGENIICLPNKVVVSVISDKQNEIDAIVN